MIIMIIFLILSVVFAISTTIYLNNKKKNTTSRIKSNNAKHLKEKTHNKSKKKLANLLQIRIKDNIICLGNRYSNVIRLGNIDYNMLSSNEQDSIETILMQTALSIDCPIQFFSTTEYIDTSQIISQLKQNKNPNINIQKYKQYLIDYLENLMENRSISVIKNYAIISYDGLYENAIEELNRKSTSFKVNLLRANIVCETLAEDELYTLIYRELNKNSTLNIGNLMIGGKNLYVDKKQKANKK